VSAVFTQPHRVGELGFRRNAIRAGVWAGWLSVAVVGAEIASTPDLRHRQLVLVLDLVAAAANLVFALVPWRGWLADLRGQLLLDLWSAGLIAYVTLLCVLTAGTGTEFSLLLFLVVPFLATVHSGSRRRGWLAVAAAGFAVSAHAVQLGVASGAIRASLLAGTVVLAETFAQATRVEAEGRADAAARAELERALLAEAHHRVKNSLQMVSDLLLLARPDGVAGAAFDETAMRIKGVATVHRLLAEGRGGAIGADTLLLRVAAGVDGAVRVDAEPLLLEAADAQQLGVVGNELIANAVRHGKPPVTVRLTADRDWSLVVEDAGVLERPVRQGLGLELVRSVVGSGLKGSFVLRALPDGGTEAEVRFPRESDAQPHRL
jgi:two-component sensor histidine kinase